MDRSPETISEGAPRTVTGGVAPDGSIVAKVD